MGRRTLTIIPADPAKPIVTRDGIDDLKELQGIVGGYIETVPHWSRYDGRLCAVYANETGRIDNLRLNRRATDLWLEALGRGPFRYEPLLFGDIVVVTSAAKAEAA